jgi:hypothetical protein
MIRAQVHTQCHKSCARYLYFKTNAEKFGVRVIRKVRAIGRKIRYIVHQCIMLVLIHFNFENAWSKLQKIKKYTDSFLHNGMESIKTFCNVKAWFHVANKCLRDKSIFISIRQKYSNH